MEAEANNNNNNNNPTIYYLKILKYDENKMK